MENKENNELNRIKLKKMREMMRKVAVQGKKKVIFDKPVEVTDKTFDETIRNNQLVVVDSWAPWCGPCQMVAPIIEELARQYAGKVLFGKLNVDENPLIAMQYGIMGIPTLLFFKNGELVDRIVGAIPKQMLEQKIKRYL
jgi:thioredoxin 1